MGMFDYVRCDYPFPDNPPEWVLKHNAEWRFQTKDTPLQFMERYIIASDGKLIYQEVEYLPDPQSTTGQNIAVPTGDVWLYDYSGNVTFHTYRKDPNDWREYRARFSEGKLLNIVRVETS